MTSKAVKVFKGANWLLFASWYSRIAGMLSFFVLARYLEKTDFGIIAGCFVVQGLFSVLANVGTGHYLIRKKEISNEDLDIAWTINFTTRTSIAILIFLLSEHIAQFMTIPELAIALKVMCLSPFFIGLHNPALSLKVKSLDYQQITCLQALAKTLTTTVTLFLAIIYKTYWAVVVAEVAYQVIYAIGSYQIVRYTPKFNFKKVYTQWNFSKWVLLKGIATYAKNISDQIVVSRSFSLADLGSYNFAREAASTVINVLLMPISSIFYAGLSEYSDNKQEIVDKLYKFLSVLTLLYTPVVFGGIYLSDIIVPTVFGSKWQDAVFLFELFLVMTFARCFNQIFSDVFILIDAVKQQFIYELVSSLVVVTIVVMASALNLEQFAAVRVMIAYAVLLSMMILLSTMIPISIRVFFSLQIIPLVLSSSMVVLISIFEQHLPHLSDISVLFILISSGVVFYLVATLVTLRVFKNINPYYHYLYHSIILKIYQLALSKIKNSKAI